MKIKYIADDDTEFDNQMDCEEYESMRNPYNQLLRLVADKCHRTYHEDAGFNIITTADVAIFILENNLAIKKIMDT